MATGWGQARPPLYKDDELTIHHSPRHSLLPPASPPQSTFPSRPRGHGSGWNPLDIWLSVSTCSTFFWQTFLECLFCPKKCFGIRDANSLLQTNLFCCDFFFLAKIGNTVSNKRALEGLTNQDMVSLPVEAFTGVQRISVISWRSQSLQNHNL